MKILFEILVLIGTVVLNVLFCFGVAMLLFLRGANTKCEYYSQKEENKKRK